MKANLRQNLRRTIITVMMFLFPVIFYYLSPYLIIMAASEGVAAGSFIVFGLMFVSSIFLGRAFCGWVCPAGAVQEILIQKSKDKPFKRTSLNYVEICNMGSVDCSDCSHVYKVRRHKAYRFSLSDLLRDFRSGLLFACSVFRGSPCYCCYYASCQEKRFLPHALLDGSFHGHREIHKKLAKDSRPFPFCKQ